MLGRAVYRGAVRPNLSVFYAWTGVPPAGLTITFGFGRSLFVGADGDSDPFGLADRLPGALEPLPHFSGDDLDPGPVRRRPADHGGTRMLRRGYNFTDGNDELGRPDAGLYFIAFTRDPRTQFTPVQKAVATDLMAEHLQHTGSALFAIPPGVPTINDDGSLVGDAHIGAPLVA